MKNFKTLLICLFAFTLLQSCSIDDDDLSGNHINPPSWIIGSWLDKSETEWAQIGGFKFTTNDLIELSADNKAILSYKESLKDGLDSGTFKINEITTSNSYSFMIESAGYTIVDYRFEKGTNNTIIYDLGSTIKVVLTKQ